MKRSSQKLLAVLVLSAACPSWLVALPAGQPANRSAAEAQESVPQSVFLMPQPGMNLRDPFYPNTTRFAPPALPVPVVRAEPTVSDLSLKAVSGTAERPLAMINNQTLAVGEEAEVATIHGRIRVRLLSVDGLKVTIAVGGVTRELRLRGYGAESESEPVGAKVPAPETVHVPADSGL